VRPTNQKVMAAIIEALLENGRLEKRSLIQAVEPRLDRRFRISEHRVGYLITILERYGVVKVRGDCIVICRGMTKASLGLGGWRWGLVAVTP